MFPNPKIFYFLQFLIDAREIFSIKQNFDIYRERAPYVLSRFFVFLAEGVLSWDRGTQIRWPIHGPIALCLVFKCIKALLANQSLIKSHNTAYPRPHLIWIHPSIAQGLYSYFGAL